MSDLYEILDDLCRSSQYLHSAGSGDVQAIEDMLRDSEPMDADARHLYIAGGIAARTLVGYTEALLAAQHVLDLEDEVSEDWLMRNPG